MMEKLSTAHGQWSVAAALARMFSSGVGGRGQNQRSAGFQTCCIADFQIGMVSQLRGVCGFGNPRYSRLGSLRYGFAHEISRRGAVRRPVSAMGFSMVELLVTMTLLSLIVLVLMAVFSSTQRAFRASVTQTDVLEGGRATMDLIATDLRTMVPADGLSNANPYIAAYTGVNYAGTPATVNFCVLDNSSSSCSYAGSTLLYQPLQQSLPGTTSPKILRDNVLNYFFLLGRLNTKWTAVGYVVIATNAVPLYPLYRFYAETNISGSPYMLFAEFMAAVNQGQWTNMSHVMDGVVNMTVQPYDAHGYWMTNLYEMHGGGLYTTNANVVFMPPLWGEVGCYMLSNTIPAAVDLQLGVLEDRTLQRAQSLANGLGQGLSLAQSNYLAQQSGHVQIFRQRVTIPNVDPSAYP